MYTHIYLSLSLSIYIYIHTCIILALFVGLVALRVELAHEGLRQPASGAPRPLGRGWMGPMMIQIIIDIRLETLTIRILIQMILP